MMLASASVLRYCEAAFECFPFPFCIPDQNSRIVFGKNILKRNMLSWFNLAKSVSAISIQFIIRAKTFFFAMIFISIREMKKAGKISEIWAKLGIVYDKRVGVWLFQVRFSIFFHVSLALRTKQIARKRIRTQSDNEVRCGLFPFASLLAARFSIWMLLSLFYYAIYGRRQHTFEEIWNLNEKNENLWKKIGVYVSAMKAFTLWMRTKCVRSFQNQCQNGFERLRS